MKQTHTHKNIVGGKQKRNTKHMLQQKVLAVTHP